MLGLIRTNSPRRKYKVRPSPANHPAVIAAKAIMSKVVSPEAAAVSTDLRVWFPGIRNQGNEGACTGFATSTCREVLYGVAMKTMMSYRLAPAYLYARTRMAEGTFPNDSGAVMADEFSVLNAYGVCPEQDMPYNQDPAEAIPAIADVAAHQFRINQPTMVDNLDVDAIKTVLSSGRPIGIAIPVYQSFEDVGADGKLPMPNVLSEAMLGGHGLAVLGYNSFGWIVPNQWGTGWGDQGYCYMPYGYEKLWFEAWTSADIM